MFGRCKNFCKLEILWAVLGVAVLSSNANSAKFANRLPGGIDNWESQLEVGLVALEANCDQNYMPFNRQKLQKELKECLRSIIAQEPTNYYNVLISPTKRGNPTQLEIFRHIYIEPICNKISQSLGCLKPHRMIIDNCAREDGKALQQLMNVSCRGNGSKLIQFLESGGIDCVLEQREPILGCFNTATDYKKNLTSSEDVCNYFRKSRDCFLSSLSRCPNTKPRQVIENLLEEVERETQGNCFTTGLLSNAGSSLRSRQFFTFWTSIFTVLSISMLAKLVQHQRW